MHPALVRKRAGPHIWLPRDQIQIRGFVNKPADFGEPGQCAGLKAGDIFDVEHPGGEVKDPISGRVLGRKDGMPVGRIRILSTMPDLSRAAPVDGTDFQIGDVVHVLPGDPPVASP